MQRHKVYVAILNHGWIRSEILFKLASRAWILDDVELVLKDPTKNWHHPISSNRNRIVKEFLKTDCDYLLMIDDDIVPLTNPLELVYADKDVIGMPAKVRRGGRYLDWVAYVKNPEKEEYAPVDFSLIDDTVDLLKVDVVGTGCILIKRKVLESIKAPFHTEFDEDGILTYGTDFAFCVKVKEAGFEIFTTPWRICEHYKEIGMIGIDSYNCIDNTDHRANQYDIPWGGMAINPNEWNFIKRMVLENHVETVLEFGAGLSSLLLSELVQKVVSYETNKEWAEEIGMKGNGNLEIRLWDGVSLPHIRGDYDLAFIDGPEGGENREAVFAITSETFDRIICHDAQREHELTWQKKYLRGKFKLKARSGYYPACCHYWERNK